MTQPWRFIILTNSSKEQYAQLKKKMDYDEMFEADESVREKHADLTYQKIHQIPLILMVVIEQNEDLEIAEEDYGACVCVIDNFMLIAWDKGIGTAWKTFKGNDELRQFLGLHDEERVVGVIYTGYPESIPDPKPRASLENRIDIKS
jgi:nitroreductase